MKDYRLDRKADPKYILDVNTSNKVLPGSSKPTKTMTITFANGRDFVNVDYVEENLQKVIQQQERQAKAGLKNSKVFEKRKTRAGVIMGLTAAGGLALLGVASSVFPEPITAMTGIGIITAFAEIPAMYSLLSNAGKLNELGKIKYRDDHREILESYPGYENALAGLPSRKKTWFESMASKGKDPFCITEIDSFSKKDMVQIVENIDTENTYGFTYVKRPTSSTK